MSGSDLDAYVFGIIGFMLAVFIIMALLYYCIIERCGKSKVRRPAQCYQDFSQTRAESITVPSRQIVLAGSNHEYGLFSGLSAASPPPYPLEPRHPTPHEEPRGVGNVGLAPGNPPYPLHDPHPIAASPVVVPPYPVEPRHPTPNVGPPGLGFSTHNPPYPTHNPHPTGAAPYPPSVGPTPYPPAVGSTPYPPAAGSAPYPPVGGSAPYPDYGAQPPSYSEAVSQPPAQPLPSKEGYSKQAPYNPNY